MSELDEYICERARESVRGGVCAAWCMKCAQSRTLGDSLTRQS
jgi:hypothetical protein